MRTQAEVEQMAAETIALSNPELVERLAEAALVAGNYLDWAQFQLADRERYIAAAALMEDCMDELDKRLAQ